jgi:hypothetical protein
MTTRKEQACIYCGKVVFDRPGYPSPNYRRHLRACKARIASEQREQTESQALGDHDPTSPASGGRIEPE